MAFEAWFTLAIIALIIVALISNRIGMDVAMLGGLVILMAAGLTACYFPARRATRVDPLEAMRAD